MQKNDIKTLSDLFLHSTESACLNPFCYQNGKEMVYISQKQFKADVLHAGYVISSIAKNSTISFIGENSYHYIVLYFGAIISGNIPVLTDKALDAETLSVIIRHSEASMVFCSAEYAENAKDIGIQTYCFDELISMYKDSFLEKPLPVMPDDICTIFHTSGSAGTPKIIPLSNKNMIAECKAMSLKLSISGKSILCLPLHHVYGMISGLLSLMYVDITLFINDSLRHLTADIKKIEPCILPIVPAIYSLLIRSLRGKNTPEAFREAVGPNLKVITFGGAPFTINPELMLKAGITVYIGYGLTETASSATLRIITAPTDDFDNVGAPMDTIDVKMSEIGEILMKGDMIFDGYLNDEKANNTAFCKEYFRTGDVGYVDENGNLHLTGRIKNLIILPNGENIPAEKLEALLYRLPYVSECIVKEQSGKITALIFPDTLQAAQDNIEKDLLEINAKLPLNHNITKYIFVDEPFKKTSGGKIMRHG